MKVTQSRHINKKKKPAVVCSHFVFFVLLVSEDLGITNTERHCMHEVDEGI